MQADPSPPSAPSLAHVEHSLRSGNQAALRRDLIAASTPLACQMIHAFSLTAISFHAVMHLELVETILRLGWREDPQLASAVCEFVQDLITASATFLRPCISALVDSFLLSEKIGEAAKEGEYDTSTDELILVHVHSALQAILRVCPLATRSVFSTVLSTFNLCTHPNNLPPTLP